MSGTLPEDFFAMLAGDSRLVTDIGAGALARIYPAVAPQGTAAPYVTWSRISVQPDLDGGVQALVQVDVWARDFSGADALAAKVRAAIESSNGAVRGALTDDSDGYDEAAQLFRRSQQYVVFHPAN